jgi:hypothetical protein
MFAFANGCCQFDSTLSAELVSRSPWMRETLTVKLSLSRRLINLCGGDAERASVATIANHQ